MSSKTRAVRFAAVGFAFFCLGILALVASILYTSSILAFIGLGIVFWGAILTYVRSEEYVTRNLMTATATSSMLGLNQTLDVIRYNGTPIYLPPRYLIDPEETKVYISRLRESSLPTPEQTQQLERHSSRKTYEGVLLTPPGAKLSELFERVLGRSFVRIDLNHLLKQMPKLITKDLEIAEDLEITAEMSKSDDSTEFTVDKPHKVPDKIHVTITNSIYREMCQEIEQMKDIHGRLGCPLTSAIACALTKTTGNPIALENEKSSSDGQIKEADYHIFT